MCLSLAFLRACFPASGITAPRRLFSQGIHLTAQVSAVVANVDAMLRTAMTPGEQHYLQRGEKWNNIQSTGKQTRHDYLVGILCGVSVTTVKACSSASRRARQRDSQFPSEPRSRGRNQRSGSELDRASCPAAEAADEDDAWQAESTWESVGWKVLEGVPGNYVESSVKNAKGHATGLVLGRLFAMCAVNNIPDVTCQKMLGFLHSVGVLCGQKFHSLEAISAYQGVLSRLCRASTLQRVWKKPSNLLFPSA